MLVVPSFEPWVIITNLASCFFKQLLKSQNSSSQLNLSKDFAFRQLKLLWAILQPVCVYVRTNLPKRLSLLRLKWTEWYSRSASISKPYPTGQRNKIRVLEIVSNDLGKHKTVRATCWRGLTGVSWLYRILWPSRSFDQKFFWHCFTMCSTKVVEHKCLPFAPAFGSACSTSQVPACCIPQLSCLGWEGGSAVLAGTQAPCCFTPVCANSLWLGTDLPPLYLHAPPVGFLMPLTPAASESFCVLFLNTSI